MTTGWESTYDYVTKYAKQYHPTADISYAQQQAKKYAQPQYQQGWQAPTGVGLGAGAQFGQPFPTGTQKYAPPIPEGEAYGLGEAGGFKWPWQTPKGVGFIAPWTPQAEVAYRNPITGEPQTTYIQAGGAPEQIQAGQEFLAGLGQPAGAMPEGWFASPYDIPPELAQNPNYEINYDPTMMAWRVDPAYGGEAAGISEFEQQYMTAQLELDRRAQDLREQEAKWAREQAGRLTPWQEAQLDLSYQELNEAQDRSMSAYEQAMMQLQQQQFGLQQQQFGFEQQQAAAQLAAQPINWLQHSALTGEQPVIQPWMLPLMPQEYEGLQVGDPIPGWSQNDMSGMPTLLNPSAQYWARMTPAQREMYLGYIQALTGQTPEDIQFRMWSAAPSGGGGLTYAR